MIDENSIAAAERVAMAEHNRRVGDEIRRIATSTRQPAPAPQSQSASTPSVKPIAKTREALTAEFERSAELRAEFGDVGTYVAYALAEQAGRVRVHRGRVVS